MYSLFDVTVKIKYNKIGDGITCGNKKAYTTFICYGCKQCDGWSGISLEECQAKCSRNEVPNAKCPRQGVKCKYVHYNRAAKWCHLADSTCNPVKGASKYTVTRKNGKHILIF